MSLRGQHVVIAGAGIIGLAAALELAEAGAQVTVCDSGAAMRESSWAAAGMLAVEDPENDPRLLPLARLSRALYPGFLANVERLSGHPVPLRTTQTLQGTRATAAMLPPTPAVEGLVPGPWQFRLLHEASLDPRDLGTALPPAARATPGVTLREHTRVGAVHAEGAGVRVTVEPAGNDLPAQTLHGDHFVLAAGAWSGTMPGPFAAVAHVVPRKGQMVEVALPDGAPPLPLVLRTPEIYLVPRTPRRIVVGATVEDAGFDRSTSADAACTLLMRASSLWPPIGSATIVAQWSGLRPGFRGAEQGLPLIGPLEQGSRCLWVATGHFRNGILLAPGTARLLRALLSGEALPVAADEFDPLRHAPPRRDKRFRAAL